eukprot:gene9185-9351_t
MAEEAASSGLFAVFLLSIYSLFLIPYTIYYFCSSGEDATTQPVAKSKKSSSFADRLKGHCTKGNLILLGLWVLWFGVLWYSQATMASMKPFDPFEILGVPRDASERDIKKAYRKLSLVYHPDKGINLGVALPDWMFAKDKKAAPLMLLALVGGGILLPLGLMSWYMLSSSKFSGPNQIHNDTFLIFLHSKYNIKESQSLVRIPETLLCAMEFISLYTPAEHNGPLEELRKLASVVKSHMLLLAHLDRVGDDVPQALQGDLRYVRTKSPQLLEEMVKIACLPRPPLGYGWMTPALACVEMMQCIAQALPVAVRKGGGKAGDTLAPLLQLPGLDQEILKKLRKRKINTLADLQALPEGARATELSWDGLHTAAVEGVQLFLSAMPSLTVAACCEVDEEDGEIMEQDPVHCRVRVLLSRPSHLQEGFALRGSAVRAYTPHNPVARDESWYFFLTEPSTNSILAWTKINLMEAEGDVQEGQEIDLVFIAPKTGNYSLALVAMSDCWVGCDETMQIKLRVAPLTRAAAEGRDLAMNKAANKRFAADDSDSEAGQ